MKMYPPHHNQGIALIITIATLALLGVALAGVSQQFITQARRTKLEAQQTQLRQWLVAGTIEAQKQVINSTAHQTATVEMKLPSSLQNENVSMMMNLQPQADHWQVSLRIASEHASVSQLLIFKKEGELQASHPPQWEFRYLTRSQESDPTPSNL
jgi:type II secretory pathway component PulK